jgi:hypothetical protein
MSYNKQQLLGQDEIEEFLGDEENFGKFHAAPGLKASRPSKKRRGESFSETPLLLRIPAQYALVFLDSPLLGLAWLRAHAMIYMELEDSDLPLVEPLLDFLTTAAHSPDESHSILMSDWEAIEDEEISQWMAPRMTMRLVMSQSPRKRPPDDKTEKRKQPPGRKSKKDRKVGGLFQQLGGGGLWPRRRRIPPLVIMLI